MSQYDWDDGPSEAAEPSPRISPAVQVLAILGFTGFAIPVSIVAMSEFGFIGLLLAAFLAWQWTRLAGLGGSSSMADTVERLKPQLGATTPPSSGNSSFDAYRTELMDRLERERRDFEGFLTRLRDAKDRSEFDRFMDQRERIVREDQAAVAA